MQLKPQEMIMRARRWFVAYVKPLVFPQRRHGVFILFWKRSAWIIKDCGLLCLSVLFGGKWSTKWPQCLCSLVQTGPNTAGGETSCKVTFCEGKTRYVAKCSCLGPSPQFHPINYSISPNNHCVNHNYTEPGVLLTKKTPAVVSLQSSLLLRRRDDGGNPWHEAGHHPAVGLLGAQCK